MIKPVQFAGVKELNNVQNVVLVMLMMKVPVVQSAIKVVLYVLHHSKVIAQHVLKDFFFN